MKDFPLIGDFYSELYGKNITTEDYEHACSVYKAFDCSNMSEYLQLYNRLDVYLLLEAMNAFRDTGWKEFGLDAAHFISLPQFGFQWYNYFNFEDILPYMTGFFSFSMLRHTGINLELISDVDMLLFLESGIRGGVSYCATRIAEREMDTENKPIQNLAYLDANNLVYRASGKSVPTFMLLLMM